MAHVATHYDQLKVMRNAPAEVIRAAYKSLSQKYHPDRNPGDDEAARIMRILNEAYAVLSDPAKRAAHDAWIKRAERASARDQEPEQAPPAPPNATGDWSSAGPAQTDAGVYLVRYVLALGGTIAGLVAVGWFVSLATDRPWSASNTSLPSPTVTPYVSTPHAATSQAVTDLVRLAQLKADSPQAEDSPDPSTEFQNRRGGTSGAKPYLEEGDDAPQAAATETVYRCEAPSGGIVRYTNRRLPGATCTTAFTYAK